MSQWQPVTRRTEEKEPTIVLGDEPTVGIPTLPERTEVLDVTPLRDSDDAPLATGTSADQSGEPHDDAADLLPGGGDEPGEVRDDAAYTLALARMQNRRLTDLGLLVLRLCALPLVLHGVQQLTHLGPAIAALRDAPLFGHAPDLSAVALGVAWVILPLLLAAGLFTRIAAAVQVALVAAVYASHLLGGIPVLDPSTGTLALEGTLAYGAVALPLVLTGAGRVSVDHVLGASRRERVADRRASRQRPRGSR